MGLMEDMGPGPVALDAAAFIYFIEENRDYLPLVEPVFAAIAGGAIDAVTSELTLLEVLVVPYRKKNVDLAAQYEALLSGSLGLSLVPVSRGVLRNAARIRATTGLKTPDAIQFATALSANCTAIVSNDRDFRSVSGLRYLRLSEYL